MSGLAPNIGASGKVRLFYFEDYDFELDQVVRSKRPATLEFIERNAP